MGYVSGVFESRMLDKQFCIGEQSVSSDELLLIVKKYIDNHPEKLNWPRAVVVHNALNEVFRCARPTAK